MPDCLMSNVWPLANHHLEAKSVIQRSLPLRIPSLSADFPYISEIPAADEMLDILLAFEKNYPRSVKAGVDLTKFEVCVKFLRVGNLTTNTDCVPGILPALLCLFGSLTQLKYLQN